jgi:S-adenosylmethionine synthetase
MFEKTSPAHPDKLADRISGAIVDHCYAHSEGGWLKSNPRVAVEVLLGHGKCYVMIETSCTRAELSCNDVDDIVHRIVGDVEIFVTICNQDPELSKNQKDGIKVGDNGIFRGCAPTYEQKVLTAMAASIYERWPYDGKYIINEEPVKNGDNHWYILTICQSHMSKVDFYLWNSEITKAPENANAVGVDGSIITFRLGKDVFIPKVNPLGEWTGGPDVDCGATNRKLGSDMGEGVTGGGLHGKDLSKGDVSINIACFLKAVQSGQTVTACCSIGDEQVTFVYAGGKTETESFRDVVEMARLYILTVGGFEKFSEWGLIRPNFPIE